MENTHLFKTSKSDIKACKELLKSGHYPQSLFYFQQSVEKVIKYIGLSMQCISEDQLQKDIKHDPLRVFTKMFDHMISSSNGYLAPLNPHEFTNAKTIVAAHSEEEAVQSAWRQIEFIVKQPKLIDESSPFDSLCDYVQKIMPDVDLKLDSPLLRSYTKKMMEKKSLEIMIFVNYGIRILQILMAYSLLLSRYKVDDFRYPTEKYGNPEDYFNQSNPIIENLTLFAGSMENIVLQFADRISWREID